MSIRRTVLVMAAGALAVGAVAMVVRGADHGDAPGVRIDSRLDINDVYAFRSPADSSHTVLSMTVSPLAGITGATTFHPQGSYEFKVDTNGDAIENLTFLVTFSGPNSQGAQEIRLRSDGARPQIVARGFTGQNIALAGGGTLRAGLFDDPFFFDLLAFRNGLKFCPGGVGTDFFRGLNTLAIVLELPSSELDSSLIGVWGHTRLGGRTVDRMGRPAISTVFIPGQLKDAYNSGEPSNDRRDFGAIVTSGLQALGAADPAGLALFLLPDILTVNTTDPNGFPNGRRLADDVIDVELGLITNGAVKSDCVANVGVRGHFSVLGRSEPVMIRPLIAAALMIPLLCGWSSALASTQVGGAASNELGGSQASGMAAAAATQKAIDQFEKRVAESPRDYLSHTILGELHARYARETGDFDSYQRAQAAFRKALDVNKDHLAAMLGLAAAFASQHEFTEALQLARTIQQANPNSVDALIVLGDASLEIGRYEDAEEAFKELQIKRPEEPSVLARLAHLAELRGKHGYALELLQRAAAKELEEEGAGETAAWYHTRIGSLLFRTGRLDEASKSFEGALRLFDGYYIALDGLADVRAAQGHEDQAIVLLERAVASVPQPASLVFLGDLYMKKGRTGDAQRVHQQAESIAQRPGSYQSAYRRELAMFYANHDRDVAKALDLAKQDLDSRPDIYGYDALAWALYKNKRFNEAAQAMTKAMALGTQDATLYAHAGLIEHERGHSAQALAYLNSANELCPYLLDDATRRLRADLSRVKR